jgi:hypothetical protein
MSRWRPAPPTSITRATSATSRSSSACAGAISAAPWRRRRRASRRTSSCRTAIASSGRASSRTCEKRRTADIATQPPSADPNVVLVAGPPTHLKRTDGRRRPDWRVPDPNAGARSLVLAELILHGGKDNVLDNDPADGRFAGFENDAFYRDRAPAVVGRRRRVGLGRPQPSLDRFEYPLSTRPIELGRELTLASGREFYRLLGHHLTPTTDALLLETPVNLQYISSIYNVPRTVKIRFLGCALQATSEGECFPRRGSAGSYLVAVSYCMRSGGSPADSPARR